MHIFKGATGKVCFCSLVMCLAIFVTEYWLMPGLIFSRTVILTDELQTALTKALPPGRFKIGRLLYKGSKDGFQGETMRQRVGGLGPTMVLIQTHSYSNSEIIGGYADMSWPKILKSTEQIHGKGRSFLFMWREGKSGAGSLDTY